MSEEPKEIIESASQEAGNGPTVTSTPAAAEPPAGTGLPEAGESLAAPDRRSSADPPVRDAEGAEPVGTRESSINIRRILDIHLPVTVSFGTTHRSLKEILKLSPGALIELDKSADDPVVLKINDKPFAWGKVVDVDGYYGVEITEILTQADRIASLGGE